MTKRDTASLMRKLVKQFEDSGQSRREFASAHGIKQGKLHYWISKLTKPQVSDSAVENNFVPIVIAPVAVQETGNIIIRCTNGVEIEIPL